MRFEILGLPILALRRRFLEMPMASGHRGAPVAAGRGFVIVPAERAAQFFGQRRLLRLEAPRVG